MATVRSVEYLLDAEFALADLSFAFFAFGSAAGGVFEVECGRCRKFHRNEHIFLFSYTDYELAIFVNQVYMDRCQVRDLFEFKNFICELDIGKRAL